MSLNLELSAKQVLEYGLSLDMKISGGVTQSVFPLTETKLNDIEYQKSLEYVARKKNADKYVSMIDFLFCEIFTEWRFHCFKFYNDNGPRLINCKGVSPSILQAYDLVLCNVVLEFALQLYKTQLHASWNDLYSISHKYIKSA